MFNPLSATFSVSEYSNCPHREMAQSLDSLQDSNLLNALTIDENTHIWKADLDQSTRVIQWLFSLLSSKEKNRSRHFIFGRDRNRYIVRHGLLRIILSHYIGIEPDRIEFVFGQNGKPALKETMNNNDIRFNLSFSGGLCLFAISRYREIGVDIEFSDRLLECDQIVHNFFAEKEKYFYCFLNKYQKKSAFFKLWTKKEAVTKAIGIGLYFPLNLFSVSLSDHEIVELPSVEGLLVKETKWEVNVLNLFPKFKASWAIEI
jgi:4'-phosphopantetheinyl transferase